MEREKKQKQRQPDSRSREKQTEQGKRVMLWGFNCWEKKKRAHYYISTNYSFCIDMSKNPHPFLKSNPFQRIFHT